MITAAIGCGAKTTKTILLKDGEIVGKGIVLTGFDPPKAAVFVYEENKMYSLRESELIQKYLYEHGEMPAGGGTICFRSDSILANIREGR